MHAKERRLNVRMKPIAELPAEATLVLGATREQIAVQDVSVGGMALFTSAFLRERKAGDEVTLHLALGAFGEHTVSAELRYVTTTATGVKFLELTPAASTAVRKYVAELLERGAMS